MRWERKTIAYANRLTRRGNQMKTYKFGGGYFEGSPGELLWEMGRSLETYYAYKPDSSTHLGRSLIIDDLIKAILQTAI